MANRSKYVQRLEEHTAGGAHTGAGGRPPFLLVIRTRTYTRMRGRPTRAASVESVFRTWRFFSFGGIHGKIRYVSILCCGGKKRSSTMSTARPEGALRQASLLGSEVSLYGQLHGCF